MTTKSRLNKNWLLYDHFKLLIFPSKTKFRLKITLKIQKKEPFFILSGRSVPLKIPILCFRLRKFSLYFSQLFFFNFSKQKKMAFLPKIKCAWVKWARGLARAKVLDFDGSNQISFFSLQIFFSWFFFQSERKKVFTNTRLQ